MDINIQPILENEKVILYPLQEKDFDALYAVASDPKIWEQHPNSDRWKKEIFQAFFDLAIESKGAFKIVDKATARVLGSTRFYNYSKQENSIFIGFTFYAVSCWGTGINRLVKNTMLDYILQHVNTVYFHVGANNTRSQIAIKRIGADQIASEVVNYPDGTSRSNFVYEITREKWSNLKEIR